MWRGDEPRARGSYRDLAGSAVPLRELRHLSDRQHREGRAEGSVFERVPNPFDEARELDWTAMWSLREAVRHVPSGFAYYGRPGSVLLLGGTNGCASGTTLDEAIVHGFMEPSSATASPSGGTTRSGGRRSTWTASGWRRSGGCGSTTGGWVGTCDLTTDLGVPASPRAPKPKTMSGAGESPDRHHLDPRVALTRAVAEVTSSCPR